MVTRIVVFYHKLSISIYVFYILNLRFPTKIPRTNSISEFLKSPSQILVQDCHLTFLSQICIAKFFSDNKLLSELSTRDFLQISLISHIKVPSQNIPGYPIPQTDPSFYADVENFTFLHLVYCKWCCKSHDVNHFIPLLSLYTP